MKRRIHIFLLLFFATVFVAEKYNIVVAESYNNNGYGNIKDSIKNCICEQQQRLHDCKFEHPQQNSVSFTRLGKNNTHRRTHDNTKSGCFFNNYTSKIKPKLSFVVCHKAVVPLIHTRQYYIYALRHIVI